MKPLSLLCTAALAMACAGNALAGTINLESYGSTASAPAGAANSATNFLGYQSSGTSGSLTSGGASYNVGTGGVWASPTGDSSWVSSNPNAYPGGGVSPAAGMYVFQTTFTDLDPLQSTGFLTLLADDTASVYLNGTLIEPAASSTPAKHCDVGVPNCTTATTFDLTDFVQGTNTLTIDNFQEHGYAEGIDYSGTVSTSVTPEPNSLLLLATGLLAGGGLMYRRRPLA